MIHVTVPLSEHRSVEIGCIVIVLPGLTCSGPFDYLGHHTFEIGKPITRRLDIVVTQIIVKRTRVNSVTRVLSLTVAVERMVIVGQQLLQMHLVDIRVACRIPTVAILDGEHIIRTEIRGQGLDSIAGLCHIIEAGIVHNRSGSTADHGSELLGAQRIDRYGIGCNHIMTQTQRMSHLMAGHKTHGISHKLVRKFMLTSARIDRTSLYYDPVVHNIKHIMPPYYISLQDLA